MGFPERFHTILNRSNWQTYTYGEKKKKKKEEEEEKKKKKREGVDRLTRGHVPTHLGGKLHCGNTAYVIEDKRKTESLTVQAVV